MAATSKLSVEEVKRRLDSGELLVFVDSRNPQAWADATATLPGAVRVPADHVAEHLDEIPADRTVVAYCT